MLKLTALGACAALAALTVSGASPAAASQTLYDNGPANGTILGMSIAFGNTVADSFTLTAASTINSISFASWDYPGDEVTSVGWAILPSVDVNAPTQQATTASSFLFTNPNGYRISENTFSITPTTLAAGTYYLLLANGQSASGSGAFWDENDGPSTGYGAYGSTFGSESFHIDGVSAAGAAPEPSTWALMLAGVGLAGYALRRGREGVFASA